MEDYNTLLLIINFVVVIALIGIVLLQRNASDGLGGIGGGSGTSGGFMTAKGSANFLTKTTSILATIFLGLCLVMAFLQARVSDGKLSRDVAQEAMQEKQEINKKAIEDITAEDFEVPTAQ